MPLTFPDRHKKKAAWLTICVGLCGSAEGVRQNAYQDVSPMRVWTICYGETRGVKKGDHYSLPECKEMLGGRLEEFGAEVDRCTHVPLTPERKAAFTDFAYNEGGYRYCEYIAPLLNAGREQEACDELLHFNTAGKIVFPGLTRRRAAERELCMEGL